MKIINRDTAKKYIYKTNGKIFSVVFIKKNGEKRKMVCKQGVGKYVKGVGHKFEPDDYGYIQTFDMAYARKEDPAKAYRFINITTLEQIKVQGKTNIIKGQKNESN